MNYLQTVRLDKSSVTWFHIFCLYLFSTVLVALCRLSVCWQVYQNLLLSQRSSLLGIEQHTRPHPSTIGYPLRTCCAAKVCSASPTNGHIGWSRMPTFPSLNISSASRTDMYTCLHCCLCCNHLYHGTAKSPWIV
jgi:hypothetical protein